MGFKFSMLGVCLDMVPKLMSRCEFFKSCMFCPASCFQHVARLPRGLAVQPFSCKIHLHHFRSRLIIVG